MITFYNEEPLDLAAVKTFGLSVKAGENPIGYFGTGMKYAIAVMVRNGITVRIIVDGVSYDFIKRTKKFRDTEYEAVLMNGEELPFTTELGKNWNTEAAFREIYCNALDEGGGVTDESVPSPPGNHTFIQVEGREFQRHYENRAHIVLEENPFVIGREAQALDGTASHAYFRGIKAYEMPFPTRFKYSLTRDCDLTEDRTIAHEYEIDCAVVRTITESTDTKFIRASLTAGKLYYEHHVNWDYAIHSLVSEEFKDVMKDLYADFSGKVPPGAREFYNRLGRPDEMPTESIPLSPAQGRMLEKAKEVCSALGYDIDLPIIVVPRLGQSVLGLAKNESVYLALEVFDMGTKMVVGTLMEELIHLETGYADMTRSLQNYLINRIMTMYEDKTGMPL